MKKLQFLPILLLALAFTSCDSAEETLPSEEEAKIATLSEYYRFMADRYNSKGFVFIDAQKGIYDSNIFYNVQSSLKGNMPVEYLKVANSKYPFSDNIRFREGYGSTSADILKPEDLSGIFGKTFKVGVPSSSGVVRTTDEKTVEIESSYIPELINVNFSNLSGESIGVGSKITWNNDPLNEKGIFASIRYNPKTQFDSEVINQYTEFITVGKTFQDIGSYTITAEDLAQIPNNAVVIIDVGRGNFDLNTTDELDGEFSLAASTSNISSFKVAK